MRLIIILMLCIVSCTAMPDQTNKIFIHGHRGCRGLLPENTLPAFEHAMTLGVDALELDVVCTADHQLLISHEPWMSHEKCTYHDGRCTPEMDTLTNIYNMTAKEAQQFICGTMPMAKFPEQKQVKTYKPLLLELVELVNDYSDSTGRKPPLLNIEIKSYFNRYADGTEKIGDGEYHPAPDAYADIAIAEILNLGIEDNCIIQSFDPRVLRSIHSKRLSLKLVYLTDDKSISLEEQLNLLGFEPYGLSPHFEMITEQVVELCRQRKIELITWTVNEKEDIARIIRMGVKHIITDYPDRAIEVRNDEKDCRIIAK